MGLAIFLVLGELAAIIIGLVFLYKILGTKIPATVKLVLSISLITAYYGPSLTGMHIHKDQCENNSGENISHIVNADSYHIVNEGGNIFEGRGILAAINDVLDKRFDYVEISVMPKVNHSYVDRSRLKRMGLSEHLNEQHTLGFYKFYLGERSNENCIAADGSIGVIADYAIGYKLSNRKLSDGKCFGAIYEKTPTSTYMVHLYEQRNKYIPHTSNGIKIIDTRDSTEIASFNTHKLLPRLSIILLTGDNWLLCPEDTHVGRMLNDNNFHLKILGNTKEMVEWNNNSNAGQLSAMKPNIFEGIGISEVDIGKASQTDILDKYGDDYKVINTDTHAGKIAYENIGISFTFDGLNGNHKLSSVSLYPPFMGKTIKGILLGKSTIRDVFNSYGDVMGETANFGEESVFEYPGIKFYIKYKNGSKLSMEDFYNKKITSIDIFK